MVKDAMHRKDVGAITFYWGKPGDPAISYRDGGGLSHIIAKHGIEVLDDVIEAIARGSGIMTKRKTKKGIVERLIIDFKDHRVVLDLNRDSSRETWLLTGYKRGKGQDRPFDLKQIDASIFFQNRISK